MQTLPSQAMVNYVHEKGLRFSIDAIYAHARMEEFITSSDYMRLRYDSKTIEKAISDVEYHLLPYTTQMQAMGYKNGMTCLVYPLPPPLHETSGDINAIDDTDNMNDSAFFNYDE